MDLETAYQPPRQFARITGISESTLAKMRMRGDGPPYVKIGRSVRYAVSAGLAWMAACARHSTSEPVASEVHARRKPVRVATVADAHAE
jgi:predicted DNA-binding transcriptional regulator AlpA